MKKYLNTRFLRISPAFYFLSFLFLIFFHIHLFCQTAISLTANKNKIISIQISGNNKTKSSIILRELKTQTGDTINVQRLEEDYKRILNLNLFKRVNMEPIQTENGITLLIKVHERWFIIPYPIFFMTDRNWKHLSYGLGVHHMNFRGRAEILSGSFWLGYNPGAVFLYHNPWLHRKMNLFLSSSIYYKKGRSKLYTQKTLYETHKGILFNLGKRYGYHTKVSFILSFTDIDFPVFSSSQSSKINNHQFLSSGLSYIWDHRDLIEYPHEGFYIFFLAHQKGLLKKSINRFRLNTDLRYYLPFFKNHTLAFRNAVNLSFGKVHPYDHLYFGYTERIRGHFFSTNSGDNRLLFSSSYRFPLIPIQHFNWSSSPYLNNFKFGISFGLFYDFGMLWDDSNISKSTKLKGWGAGLHFHVPYVNVLRFELAFDEKMKSEIIFDMFVDI